MFMFMCGRGMTEMLGGNSGAGEFGQRNRERLWRVRFLIENPVSQTFIELSVCSGGPAR